MKNKKILNNLILLLLALFILAFYIYTKSSSRAGSADNKSNTSTTTAGIQSPVIKDSGETNLKKEVGNNLPAPVITN